MFRNIASCFAALLFTASASFAQFSALSQLGVSGVTAEGNSPSQANKLVKTGPDGVLSSSLLPASSSAKLSAFVYVDPGIESEPEPGQNAGSIVNPYKTIQTALASAPVGLAVYEIFLCSDVNNRDTDETINLCPSGSSIEQLTISGVHGSSIGYADFGGLKSLTLDGTGIKNLTAPVGNFLEAPKAVLLNTAFIDTIVNTEANLVIYTDGHIPVYEGCDNVICKSLIDADAIGYRLNWWWYDGSHSHNSVEDALDIIGSIIPDGGSGNNKILMWYPGGPSSAGYWQWSDILSSYYTQADIRGETPTGTSLGVVLWGDLPNGLPQSEQNIRRRVGNESLLSYLDHAYYSKSYIDNLDFLTGANVYTKTEMDGKLTTAELNSVARVKQALGDIEPFSGNMQELVRNTIYRNQGFTNEVVAAINDAENGIDIEQIAFETSGNLLNDIFGEPPPSQEQSPDVYAIYDTVVGKINGIVEDKMDEEYNPDVEAMIRTSGMVAEYDASHNTDNDEDYVYLYSAGTINRTFAKKSEIPSGGGDGGGSALPATYTEDSGTATWIVGPVDAEDFDHNFNVQFNTALSLGLSYADILRITTGHPFGDTSAFRSGNLCGIGVLKDTGEDVYHLMLSSGTLNSLDLLAGDSMEDAVDSAFGIRIDANGISSLAADGDLRLGSAITLGGPRPSGFTVGQYSIASGTGAKAIGDYSAAIGENSEARGNYSIAWGPGATTYFDYGIAIGPDTFASGSGYFDPCLALGHHAQASGDYSMSVGTNSFANAKSSFAQGEEVNANGLYSFVRGLSISSIGDYSISQGREVSANGNYSVAIGYNAVVGTSDANDATRCAYSLAIGNNVTVKNAKNSIVLGQNAKTQNNYKFVWNGMSDGVLYEPALGVPGVFCINPVNGLGGIYVGDKTLDTLINNKIANAGGGGGGGGSIDLSQYLNKTDASSVIGGSVYLQGSSDPSLVVGTLSDSHVGIKALAQGNNVTASGDFSHANGSLSRAVGPQSHAEGYNTYAAARSSHAEGSGSVAMGDISHAEGELTEAIGLRSHTEGVFTRAYGDDSHAEGNNTFANGIAAHAEGTLGDTVFTSSRLPVLVQDTNNQFETPEPHGLHVGDALIFLISGNQPFYATVSEIMTARKFKIDKNYNRPAFSQVTAFFGGALGANAHSEGASTFARGDQSHSEGEFTSAGGTGSHAEGIRTSANGDYSHAEGSYSVAEGDGSHVIGFGSVANSDNSFVSGALGTANHADSFVFNGDRNAGVFSNTRGRSFIVYPDQVVTFNGSNGYPTTMTLAGLFGVDPAVWFDGDVPKLSYVEFPGAEGFAADNKFFIAYDNSSSSYKWFSFNNPSLDMSNVELPYLFFDNPAVFVFNETYTSVTERPYIQWSVITGTYTPYSSHGVGTFNVNPVGGVNGFYIGENTLAECIAQVNGASVSSKASRSDVEQLEERIRQLEDRIAELEKLVGK